MYNDCDHSARLLSRISELTELRDVTLVAGVDKAK